MRIESIESLSNWKRLGVEELEAQIRCLANKMDAMEADSV